MIDYQWDLKDGELMLASEAFHLYSDGHHVATKALTFFRSLSGYQGVKQWSTTGGEGRQVLSPILEVKACSGSECLPMAEEQICCFLHILAIVATVAAVSALSIGTVLSCVGTVSTGGASIVACLELFAGTNLAIGGLALAVDEYLECRQERCPDVALRSPQMGRNVLAGFLSGNSSVWFGNDASACRA